jgi:hypothetical protein
MQHCRPERFEQHWHISENVDQMNRLKRLVQQTTYFFAE